MGTLYRRIWVLRSCGRPVEARRLEDAELSGLLAKIRGSEEAGADLEARIAALRDEEKARVAEAVAFAEILAPMLAERLGPPTSASGLPSKPGPRARAPKTADEDRGIADFIEEMLIQDRARPT